MDTNSNNPSLYEVSQMRQDWGLEGEADTHLVVFLSFLGGGFVMMTGLSSGGKDAVVNAAEYSAPDDWVFKVPTSMSKTVLYEQAMEINGCPVHRHKDISNIAGKDWLEDIWKAHGDGRSISHSFNDVTGGEREAITQTLHPPNCMVLFLASDNDQVDLNDYPEVRNRALVVGIDDSKDLTERVNSRQADLKAGRVDYNLTEQRTQEIRDYISGVPIHMYNDDGNGGFLNPVAPPLDNQNPLPQHFTEARRDFPRLLSFQEAVTLFHWDDRMEVPRNEWDSTRDRSMVTMLVTPADAWYSMRVFGEKMVLSALNLRDKDFELLEILRSNYGDQYDVGRLQQMMRRRGWNITDTDVRTALKNMKVKGYVRVDKTGTPHEWAAADFAQQISRGVEMDWPTIIEETRDVVYECYPESVASEYEDRFLTGDGLLVTHPFEGHTVNLMEEEANELEQKVEEQEQKEEEDGFGGEQGSLF